MNIEVSESNSTRTTESEVSSIRSDWELREVKGFMLEKIGVRYIGSGMEVESTAISPTCQTIALLSYSSFQIFSVGNTKSSDSIALKCCGFNDGRHGISRKIARESISDWTSPRRPFPTYVCAAMSDTILCVACKENCIDIHETSSGRRITTVSFPNRRYRTHEISPNGSLLAVGMEKGEILMYDIGSEVTSYKEKVLNKSLRASGSVKCIAFSPDSTLISYCTSENIIYTYSLNESNEGPISRYNWNSYNRGGGGSGHGVSGLS